MNLATPDPQTAYHGSTIAPSKTSNATRPGQTLLDTAVNCMQTQSWKKAIIALKSAQTLRPNDHEIDQLLLEAAANGRRRKLVRQCRERLGDRLTRSPGGLYANAAAYLAEQNYAAADKAARAGVQLDPGNARGWTLLAASYAGLGWFEQSDECLDAAGRHGQAEPLELWYLGRATNNWAMDRSKALIVTVVASVLVGIFIAFSIGIATPFFTREYRVRKLSGRSRELAEQQWTSDPKPRVLAGAASLGCLVIYLAIVLFVVPRTQ